MIDRLCWTIQLASPIPFNSKLPLNVYKSSMMVSTSMPTLLASREEENKNPLLELVSCLRLSGVSRRLFVLNVMLYVMSGSLLPLL